MINENYRTPNSNLDENSINTVKTLLKVKGVVFLLLCMWLSFGLAKIIPQFSSTFSAFGAQLPFITYLSVQLSPFYIWLAWLNVLFLFIWVIFLILKKAELKLYKFIKYYLFLFLTMFFIVIVSMYLPVFMLAK